MARWEPDARGRLLRAALDLFSERGYESTTAAQIAERAGLTKTTLFRHFADKREILFQGQEALTALARSGVESAPADASPFDAMTAGVLALCRMHAEEQRAIGRQIAPLLESSQELRERAIFKRAAITDALQGVLAERIGDDHAAGTLADLGIRAYYEGFDAWIASSVDTDLASMVTSELASYRASLLFSAS